MSSNKRKLCRQELPIKKDGIVLIDKPEGMTSHDVVSFIRKRFGFKKVGHAGTLDPMATGLLIILLEGFTKESIRFSNYDKEYEATLKLGVTTDTADRKGRVTETENIQSGQRDPHLINEVFKRFEGEISQVPPMYSAKKINGKKLYELARKGKTLKREPRKVIIKDIKVLDISLPLVTFYVKCSKGTYIRQLAHDIGKQIGCGAHLVLLRRTKIGPFSVSNALELKRSEDRSFFTRKEEIYESILQPR